MPTPDEELDALFGDAGASPAPVAPTAAALSPDDELDALFASDAAAPAAAPAAKPGKVIEMPTQTIEYEAPKSRWYDSLVPNTKAIAHGAAAGATMNWGEEGAGLLSAGLSKVLPGVSDPEGYEREYAAGSQSADMTRGLEAENAKLREENPGSFMLGEAAGALPAAVVGTAGVGSVLRPVLGAGLNVGAAGAGLAETAVAGGLQGAAAGSGADTENRLRGAGIGAATGAATGAALHGISDGLSKVATNLPKTADALMTQTFMSPAQRSAYQLAKGPNSLQELGANAREAGLFKGKWHEALLPATAKRVARNSVQTMQKAGDDIGKFENELSEQGINPDVDVRPIVDNLRKDARDFEVPVVGASADSSLLHKQADMLEMPDSAPVTGKVERPPALPEWSLSKPSRPQYGAAVEPVQEPLPGTELPPITADRPLPPPRAAEQLELPTPRAMPDKQLELNLPPRNPLAYSPEPTQMQMDLPRQQPTQQTGFDFPETQGGLGFDQSQITRPTPATGGTPQENLFLGSDPVRPPSVVPNAPVARDAQQLDMQLPDRQMPLPLENPAPKLFTPEGRTAHQLNLPVQQELPLPARPPAPPALPAPAPAAPRSPLAGRQETIDPELLNVNRGPQPELSTPLEDTTAQITRDSLPLTDAMRMKRYLGQKINWAQKPNAAHTGLGEDAAHKISWKGVSDQIDAALKGDSRVDPAKLAGYDQAKKNYHTAATAYDPAIRMAERTGEIGLSARNLMAGSALGGGPLGGLAVMADKTAAGAVPSIVASQLRRTAAASRGLAPLMKGAARVSPVTEARRFLPEGTDESKVREEANEKVKQDLQELLEQNK